MTDIKWATVRGESHAFSSGCMQALCGAVRLKRTKLREKPGKKTCEKCRSILPRDDFSDIELEPGDELIHRGKTYRVVGADEEHVYLKEAK